MWKQLLAVLLISGLLAGCDKDSEASRETSSATAPKATTPTTQQLLAGPRVKLNLKFAPYTLQVPPGWEIKTYNDGNLVVLQGPAPTEAVSISIPVSKSITPEQEKNLEAHAIQQASKNTDLMKGSPVRDIPGAKVIEQVSVDNVAPSTEPANTSEPLQTLQWTFALCVPNGKQFTVDELRFVGMTTHQFKNDELFLRSIINSAEFTPAPVDPTVK